MSWFIMGTCRRCNRTLSVAECPACHEPYCAECAVHHHCPKHPWVGPAAEAAAADDDATPLAPTVREDDEMIERRYLATLALILSIVTLAANSWAVVKTVEHGTRLAVTEANYANVQSQLKAANEKLDRLLEARR